MSDLRLPKGFIRVTGSGQSHAVRASAITIISPAVKGNGGMIRCDGQDYFIDQTPDQVIHLVRRAQSTS